MRLPEFSLQGIINGKPGKLPGFLFVALGNRLLIGRHGHPI